MSGHRRRAARDQPQPLRRAAATGVLPSVRMAEAHFVVGRALQASGRHEEAVAVYTKALEAKRDYAEVHNNLGVALNALQRHDEAVASYRRAISLRPRYALAHYNLANALSALERHEDAIAGYRAALELRPGDADAHNSLGTALHHLGFREEAMVSYRRALSLKPHHAEAHSNLAGALSDQQRYAEALVSAGEALRIRPDYSDAHLRRAELLLRLGDYESGWTEYEWRWGVKGSAPRLELGEPLWLGREELAGKSILLHAEQGLGDTLQFVRYAPLVAGRGARVVLQVQASLKALLALLPGVEMLIANEDVPPACDFQCPLMSLPLAFGTAVATIPAAVPYLHADPNEVLRWRNRLGDRGGLRVGLVWAGSPGNPLKNRMDRRRSMTLAQFSPLADVAGIEFFSLQKGDPARQAASPPPGMTLFDHTDMLEDFADTAALVSQLDLVITVDTSVAHLAGGMGKPVWILSRFDGCWRWLVGRDDSPWYPTARVFRQSRPGNWDSVMAQVRNALPEVSTGAVAAMRRRM